MSFGIFFMILAPEGVNVAPHSMIWVVGKLRFSMYIASCYPSPARGSRGLILTPNEGHPVGWTKTWFQCLIAPRRSGGTLLSQGCEYFFPLVIWTFFRFMGAKSERGGGGTGNLVHKLRVRWPLLLSRITYLTWTKRQLGHLKVRTAQGCEYIFPYTVYGREIDIMVALMYFLFSHHDCTFFSFQCDICQRDTSKYIGFYVT